MSECYGISSTSIRKHLHQHPEVSGQEAHTAAYIAEQLQHLQPDALYSGLGGHGIVAIKRFGEGKAVAFRAELDGLPIAEHSNTTYQSTHRGKSHTCGHDGHMAMVLEFACKLCLSHTSIGTLVLIFQPAEETGQGANALIEDLLRLNVPLPEISAIFAIHNIPGFDLGKLILKEHVFACASVGMEVVLNGRTAHAAHPEGAVNPLLIAAELVAYSQQFASQDDVKGFALCTPISLSSGSETFGTSPPHAHLRFTLRAALDKSLESMKSLLKQKTSELCNEAGASYELTEHECFPATVNAPFADKAIDAARAGGLQYEIAENAFRWSEDFAHFARLAPIFLMGLGSGKKQPALHAPNFDFPDELIPEGSKIYMELYKTFSQ